MERRVQYRAAMKDKLPDALLCASVVRTARKMLRYVRSASKAAKMECLTLHDRQHSHAVTLLQAGATAQLVKVHPGHKDTNLGWRVHGNDIADDRDYALIESEAELLVEAASDTPADGGGPARTVAQ
jgi:integrase